MFDATYEEILEGKSIMKIKWFRVWKMEGKTLKESWKIAFHDPSWWLMVGMLIMIILVYVFRGMIHGH